MSNKSYRSCSEYATFNASFAILSFHHHCGHFSRFSLLVGLVSSTNHQPHIERAQYFGKPDHKHHSFVYLVMLPIQKMLHCAFECLYSETTSLVASPEKSNKTTTVTLPHTGDAPLGARFRSNPNSSHRNYAAPVAQSR